MRSTFITVTCLCTVLIALPVLAKDKKSAKQMDPQAMMELYKQLGTPGEPHKLFASLAGSWTTKRAPLGSTSSNQTLPLCRSMIDFEIDRPMPVPTPTGLVVK